MLFGLLVTWASLYTFGRINWPVTPSHATDFNDMEHCASHAVVVSGMLATALLPSIVFAILNAIAYRRWSARKRGIVFGGTTLFVVMFHRATYAIPALGIVG
ncbi:hypothetical protein [Burkholderia sp. PU8-34]